MQFLTCSQILKKNSILKYNYFAQNLHMLFLLYVCRYSASHKLGNTSQLFSEMKVELSAYRIYSLSCKMCTYNKYTMYITFQSKCNKPIPFKVLVYTSFI